jgi:hypothetical protein
MTQMPKGRHDGVIYGAFQPTSSTVYSMKNDHASEELHSAARCH